MSFTIFEHTICLGYLICSPVLEVLAGTRTHSHRAQEWSPDPERSPLSYRKMRKNWRMKRVMSQPITKSNIWQSVKYVEVGHSLSVCVDAMRTLGLILGIGLGGITLADSLQSITSSARDFRTFFIGGRCWGEKSINYKWSNTDQGLQLREKCFL